MIYYDLHIHSCLSPCAADDMTPNNIVNMSIIKGLDYISVTDHNSLAQQYTMKSVADVLGINYIYGVEVESKEKVHVLVYFTSNLHVLDFDHYLVEHLPLKLNDPKYYGRQILMDDLDQEVGELANLLIQSTNLALKDITKYAKTLGAKVVLAHILDRTNSITKELGTIPSDLEFDGFEVKDLEQLERALKMYPILKNKTCFISSDAHSLINIKEKEYPKGEKEFKEFFNL